MTTTTSRQHSAGKTVESWENAYTRFETPEQEVAKFQQRLKKLGAVAWPKDARIVEIFCGRGNGLNALERLGFVHLEGIDLSARLLSLYRGRAIVQACDCRSLPFPDQSRDVLIVQGGLHHLPSIPESLEEVLREVHRVLKDGGRFMIVEPWLTPFLKFVHFVTERPLARKASGKIDALATMIENERETYEQWLGQPQVITALVRKYFTPLQESFAWGKWSFLGVPLR